LLHNNACQRKLLLLLKYNSVIWKSHDDRIIVVSLFAESTFDYFYVSVSRIQCYHIAKRVIRLIFKL